MVARLADLDDGVVHLPPRDPEIAKREMLVTFDIDCGELVPGHHFVARGLSAEQIPHPDDLVDTSESLSDIVGVDGSFFVQFVRPADHHFDDSDKSLEVRLWRRSKRRDELEAAARRVPGFDLWYELVPGLTEAEDEDGFFPYLVAVDYSADLPLPWEISDGGAMAPSEGGMSTAGCRGAWPIPDGARILTFEITGFDKDTREENDTPDGTLSVDLTTKDATWTGTQPTHLASDHQRLRDASALTTCTRREERTELAR